MKRYEINQEIRPEETENGDWCHIDDVKIEIGIRDTRIDELQKQIHYYMNSVS